MLIGVYGFALRYWVVTTTCGEKSPLRTVDAVTVEQLEALVSQINYDLCGTRPSNIQINI